MNINIYIVNELKEKKYREDKELQEYIEEKIGLAINESSNYIMISKQNGLSKRLLQFAKDNDWNVTKHKAYEYGRKVTVYKIYFKKISKKSLTEKELDNFIKKSIEIVEVTLAIGIPLIFVYYILKRSGFLELFR